MLALRTETLDLIGENIRRTAFDDLMIQDAANMACIEAAKRLNSTLSLSNVSNVTTATVPIPATWLAIKSVVATW